MRKLLQSAAFRLGLPYVVVFMCAVGALLAGVWLHAQRELAGAVDRVIAAELAELRAEYDQGGLQALVTALQSRSAGPDRPGAVHLLIDASGHRVAGNLPAWPESSPGAAPWIEFVFPVRADDAAVTHPARAAVATLDTHHLLVGTDVTERRAYAAQLRDTLLRSALLATLLAGLAGTWYTRRVGARVRATARACEQILAGEPARRLPAGGSGDEFDQLAAAVNLALDRLEKQTQAVRATFASAAHELRAPLQRLRMRLESAAQRSAGEELREALGVALAELDRVQRTLATLLQIASASADAPLRQVENVDLAALAHEIAELYAPAAREAGLALAVHAPAACVISGNRELLAQLLASLLENVLRFVPAGGAVEVNVGSGDDGTGVLGVVDNGPGIPAAQRAQALEPFGRLEREAGRPGTGLGLSLVAAVVRLHGGRLVLAERSPGLEVRCEFPPARAPLTPP